MTRPVARRAVLRGSAAVAGLGVTGWGVAGCSLGPHFRRPGLDLPAAFLGTPSTAAAAWPAPGWWRRFGSPELDALIDRARGFNTDLVAAAARVVQADAQARISGAPLLPTLDATGNASYTRSGLGRSRSSAGLSGLGGGGGGGHYIDSRSYSVALAASYEVDFWGRNRATYEQAAALAVASRFDQATVALTVVSSVADTYFQVLAGQDRLRVAERNLHDSSQILGAYRARLSVGTANALDVSQQEALVAGQRANIPALRNTVEQQKLALGILLGTPPERVMVAGGSLNDLPLPSVAPGLPSALLERRPDIAYAEAQLVAANASIRAARAAFFPSITLTAQGGLTSAALSSLTGPGTLVAQLAAGLAQPIFDNGLRRGELDLAKGRYAELVAAYARSVLQSFTDVEQALAALRYAAEQETLEREAIKVAERSAAIARAQLQAGTIDIITSLNTQTTLFSDLDLLTQIRLARFQALVALFRALGGGWQEPTTPIPGSRS